MTMVQLAAAVAVFAGVATANFLGPFNCAPNIQFPPPTMPSFPPAPECKAVWHPEHGPLHIPMDNCGDHGATGWHWVQPLTTPVPDYPPHTWATSTITTVDTQTVYACAPTVETCPDNEKTVPVVTTSVIVTPTICPAPVITPPAVVAPPPSPPAQTQPAMTVPPSPPAPTQPPQIPPPVSTLPASPMPVESSPAAPSPQFSSLPSVISSYAAVSSPMPVESSPAAPSPQFSSLPSVISSYAAVSSSAINSPSASVTASGPVGASSSVPASSLSTASIPASASSSLPASSLSTASIPASASSSLPASSLPASGSASAAYVTLTETTETSVCPLSTPAAPHDTLIVAPAAGTLTKVYAVSPIMTIPASDNPYYNTAATAPMALPTAAAALNARHAGVGLLAAAAVAVAVL